MAFLINITDQNYKSIFIFYLIIAANFIANIFGCSARKLFESNMFIKHIIGFFTLYYFIILEDPHKETDTDEYIFFKKLGVTLLIYLIFILSSRTNNTYFTLFLILLAIVFLLNNYNDSLNKTKYKSRIDTIKTIITWLSAASFLVIVIGFIVYYFEKRQQYKKDFKYTVFLLGTKKCKNLN